MSVFCATTLFQLFYSLDVWIGSFLCKVALVRTLQIQWSSCWSGISEMLELSAVTSQWSGRPDYLILIRVTSVCEAIWKMLYSVLRLHLAKLKAHIAQHILNLTSEILRSVVKYAVSRFQLLAENGGQHIENILHQSREILKAIWWMLFMWFLVQDN